MLVLMYVMLCYDVCLQVEWAREHLEKPIAVKDVFDMNEVIDTIGVTRGKGFKGKLPPSVLLYFVVFMVACAM